MAHLCHRCRDGSGSSGSSVGRLSRNSAFTLHRGTIVGCFCLLACRSAEWTCIRVIGERIDRHPGGYEVVRRMLGHTNMSTTLQALRSRNLRRRVQVSRQRLPMHRPASRFCIRIWQRSIAARSNASRRPSTTPITGGRSSKSYAV